MMPPTIAEREAELAALQSAFDEYITSSRELEEELDTELAKMQEKLGESSAANAALSSQLENIAPQLASLEKALTDTRYKLEQEQTQRRLAEQRQDDAEHKCREAQGALLALKEDADAAHEELAFKESELEETRLELDVETERHRVELEEVTLELDVVRDQMEEAKLVAASLQNGSQAAVPVKIDTTEEDAFLASATKEEEDNDYVRRLEDELELVTEQLIETEQRLTVAEDALVILKETSESNDQAAALTAEQEADMTKLREEHDANLEMLHNVKEELELAQEELLLTQEELKAAEEDVQTYEGKFDKLGKGHRDEANKARAALEEAQMETRTMARDLAAIEGTSETESPQKGEANMVLQRNNLSLMGVDSLYLLSLRRSIVVASASTVVMMQDCRMERLHEYVILSREHKELEVALKSTEMALLQKMETEMKPLEQVRICYELLDTDGVDGICAGELTEALRKMKDSSITGEIKTIAEMATRNHSKDGTGIIMIDELEGFLKSQQEDLQCTFSELCQLCVSKIAFSADGRAVLEEMIAQNCLDGQKDDFGSSVIRARLVLVFQMLDIQQSGRIPFRRVVKHLFRFAQSFEWDGRDVLLMMEVDDSRTLNMNEFLEFMLNFTASLPTRCALHEVTNAMTLSSCRETVSDHDIKDLFVDKAKRFDALQADDDGFEDILTLGKLHRLHRLMDRDKSGKLDQFELALGLRKFTVCRPDLQDTIEESLEAIRSVDEDGDGLLDVREFAKLLAKFANTAEVDLHRLIDFMVVQCSMECNCEEELAYIESYAKLKSDEASRRRSSFVTMALHAFWPGDNNRPTEAV